MRTTRVNCEHIVLEAWRDALVGNTASAMQLLLTMDEGRMPVASGADLYARLLLREGDIAGARDTWTQMLRRWPEYGPAKTALKTLDSRWLYKAVAGRLAGLLAVGVLAPFTLLGMMVVPLGVPPEAALLVFAALLLAGVAIFLAAVGIWLVSTSASRSMATELRPRGNRRVKFVSAASQR